MWWSSTRYKKPANLNKFGTPQRFKKNPANPNRFENENGEINKYQRRPKYTRHQHHLNTSPTTRSFHLPHPLPPPQHNTQYLIVTATTISAPITHNVYIQAKTPHLPEHTHYIGATTTQPVRRHLTKHPGETRPTVGVATTTTTTKNRVIKTQNAKSPPTRKQKQHTK
ncbi:hypothetical protein QL285_020039 [Trifolium repens]|nr:hypothetical protein QL285_020039 [Trifolium repens]